MSKKVALMKRAQDKMFKRHMSAAIDSGKLDEDGTTFCERYSSVTARKVRHGKRMRGRR